MSKQYGLGISALAMVLAAACTDSTTPVAGPSGPAFAKGGLSGIICPSYGDGTGASGGSVKIETGGDVSLTFVSAPTGYLISGYCVKAGTESFIVPVDPPVASLQVVSPNGKAVSHFALLYTLQINEVDGQWCSPGYWKNHSSDAAVAAALDDVSNPLLPSNWQDILANPKNYGGTLFNYVGSVLSHLHPDVDFTLGDPVIHNCPLSGPAN